jgi:hypothetical protein
MYFTGLGQPLAALALFGWHWHAHLGPSGWPHTALNLETKQRAGDTNVRRRMLPYVCKRAFVTCNRGTADTVTTWWPKERKKESKQERKSTPVGVDLRSQRGTWWLTLTRWRKRCT